MNVDFGIAEVDLEENGCDTKKRQKSPDKKSITASVGSYASVLKGREKNKMSGKNHISFDSISIGFTSWI